MAEGGDRAGQPGQTEIRFPGQLADQAREIMAGARPPVTPRDAATVMLLRAAGPPPGRLEVYMLRRQSSMAFAPGAQVFPGGAVDPRDADEEVAWAGPDTPAWGRIFDAPPELARALVCAAVRETFEESGVLLAGPDAGAVVADTTSDDWEADRTALLDRSLSLAELLGRLEASAVEGDAAACIRLGASFGEAVVLARGAFEAVAEALDAEVAAEG